MAKTKTPKKEQAKPLTNDEKADIWSKVQWEGFDYWLLQYQSKDDVAALAERMGFSGKKMKEALELISEFETEIGRFEEFVAEKPEEELEDDEYF